MRFKRLVTFTFVSWLMLSISCNSQGQESEDPFSSPEGSKSESEWGSGGSGEGWLGTAGVIGERDPITSGGIGCPVIVVGSQVFSTETLARGSSLDVKYSTSTLTALSRDGSYFAVASKSHNQKKTSVSVFDVASGKKVSEIPGEKEEILDVLLITRNKYVITAGRSSPVVRVWKADTGKMVKKFTLSTEHGRLDQGKVAFTSDGNYMAIFDDKHLKVIKVSSSKVVAVMQPPSLTDSSSDSKRRVSSNDHVFIYAWIQDMKFSPNGKELAAVSTHQGNRILCWNQRAKLVVNKTFSSVWSKAFWENDLQWFSDGDAWLVGGNLLDRKTGNVLLAFDSDATSGIQLMVHDQNTVIGLLESKPTELSKLKIPWEQINRSRQAMKEKKPAYIAPYVPVDIKIDLEKVRGAAGEVEKLVTRAIKARLEKDQIGYKSGSPNYFRLRFSESKGDTLPIYKRQSIADFRGRDTGQTATEAKGLLIVEFYVEGKKEPLWRERFSAKSSRSFRGDVNDKTLRDSMLRSIAYRLAMMHFPYFMPKDESLVSLPIILN